MTDLEKLEAIRKIAEEAILLDGVQYINPNRLLEILDGD